jgi:hypothetical protein
MIFFTETLTVPKMKYLENDANKKYESIYHIIFDKNNIEKEIPDKNNIEKEIPNKIDIDNNNSNLYTTDIHSLPLHSDLDSPSNTDEMKNELKSFLKNQLNTTTDGKEDSISFYQMK